MRIWVELKKVDHALFKISNLLENLLLISSVLLLVQQIIVIISRILSKLTHSITRLSSDLSNTQWLNKILVCQAWVQSIGSRKMPWGYPAKTPILRRPRQLCTTLETRAPHSLTRISWKPTIQSKKTLTKIVTTKCNTRCSSAPRTTWALEWFNFPKSQSCQAQATSQMKSFIAYR